MASPILINKVSAALLDGSNLADAREFFDKKLSAAVDAKDRLAIKRYQNLLDDIDEHEAKSEKKAAATSTAPKPAPAPATTSKGKP